MAHNTQYSMLNSTEGLENDKLKGIAKDRLPNLDLHLNNLKPGNYQTVDESMKKPSPREN